METTDQVHFKNSHEMSNLSRSIQIEIEEVNSLAQSHRDRKCLPRLNDFVYVRTNDVSPYISFLMIFKCFFPKMNDVVKIEFLIRLHLSTPHIPRAVTCAAGVEYLPDHLEKDKKLHLPWMERGWPENYSLRDFAYDTCNALNTTNTIVSSFTSTNTTSREYLGNKKNYQIEEISGQMSERGNICSNNGHPMSFLPSAPTTEGTSTSFFEQLGIQTSKLDRSIIKQSQICVKCRKNQELRRFLVDINIDYNTLLEKIRKLYKLDKTNEDIKIHYKDREGDICLISSNEELYEAFHTISVNGEETLNIVLSTKERPISIDFDLIELSPIKRKPSKIICKPTKIPLSNSITSSCNSPTPTKSSTIEKKSQQNVISSSMQSPSSYAIREISLDEIKLGDVIGEGSSCKVYKGVWRGTDVAVKLLGNKDPDRLQKEFHQEVTMMTQLGAHPSIVMLLVICRIPLAMVFECLPFSLFDFINGSKNSNSYMPSFPDVWSKRIQMMLDVSKGLQFLHSFNIIHRDLKSLNLLVTESQHLKLSDFGLARLSQEKNHMTGCCGTYQWMAPEVMVSQTYSIAADIYSFAVVMWEICEAGAPFENIIPTQAAMGVLHQGLRPPLSEKLPQPLKQLITQCWQQNPKKRPSADQCSEYLYKCLQLSYKSSPTSKHHSTFN